MRPGPDRDFQIFLWTIIFIFAVFMALVQPARAEWGVAPLDAFASKFSTRPSTVVCRSEAEDPEMTYAWGYVYWPPTEPYTTYVNDKVCLGALAVDLDVPEVPDWQKVLGVAVILHESFHLKPVPGAGSEKVTECRAFRNLDRGLRALGAEPAVVDRLMPLAIARHFYFVRRVPEYDMKSCAMPKRYSYWMGE